ncbi:MAG: YtxH domain-containing protein [Chloroflexota bacterium]
MSRKLLGLLLGFLLGAALGSLAVMIFAPVTGKKLRMGLRDNVKKAQQAAREAEEQQRAKLEADLARLRQTR